jgi:hypothetical protein
MFYIYNTKFKLSSGISSSLDGSQKNCLQPCGLGQETVQTGNRIVNLPLYSEMASTFARNVRRRRNPPMSTTYIVSALPKIFGSAVVDSTNRF